MTFDFEPISDHLLNILEHNFQHSRRLSSGLPSSLSPSFSPGEQPYPRHDHFTDPSSSSPSSPFSPGEQPHSYPRHDHFTDPSSSSPIPAPPTASFPSGLFLSDIPAKPLTWLWPGRIPLGHLTLLDAAPGSDPSLFALTIAATISSGTPLPDSSPIQPANVILFAPYDSASDTLKPRLEAAGGDPSHVILFRPTRSPHPSRLPTPTPTPTPAPIPTQHTTPTIDSTPAFTLPHDLPQLAATIRSLDARLVILDPASAIPGLSRSLPALLDLAQQTNCAILLIRSLRQPVSHPLHSPGPSSPLLEAARSRLLLTPDPQHETRLLLLTTRHLLCPQPTILAYNLRFPPSGLPTLHYLGEHDPTHLARLSTGPMHSLHRQAILRFLHNSTSPQTIPAILTATSYDHEAGRQMLTRMKQAGELISPARGLYTTPDHPSLAQFPNHLPAVTNVPTLSPIANIPQLSSSPIPNIPTNTNRPTPPVTNVPNIPLLSSSIVPNIPNIPNIPNPLTTPLGHPAPVDLLEAFSCLPGCHPSHPLV